MGVNMIKNMNYESKVDFKNILRSIDGYKVEKIFGKVGMGVFFEGKLVARYFGGNDFYKFLDESNINWQVIISKRLFSDNAILIIIRKTIYFLKLKIQQVPEHIDEEDLMMCDFNRKQYLKLVAPLGLKVEYVYVLSDWFKKSQYKDVLDYIQSVNCHYKFNELPLAWLGLPTKQ